MAEKARGRTSPNPMVGAVIVKNGKIIAEGFHEQAGKDHAEVAALKKAGNAAKGAALYVTLEPCCHQGKTPPCTDALIASGIKKVVLATQDPNPLVAGKGMAQLKKAGITVMHGLLQKEAQRLNEAFNKYITQKSPFVTLKAALSLDGKIAAADGSSKWISNERSRQRVHEMRDAADAVIVGVNTVLKDDPRLNVRLAGKKKPKHPLRVIVDSRLQTPPDAHVLHSHGGEVLIAACHDDARKRKALENEGATVIILPEKNKMVDLKELMKELGKRETVSALIEGGATIFTMALEEGLVDKVALFYAPIILGGSGRFSLAHGEGVKSIEKAIRLRDFSITPIDEKPVKLFAENVLIEGYVSK